MCMKNVKTWQFIRSNLKNNEQVMLLYVLESKGSSPGRQGFFMAVNNTNQLCGSIGGGIMEHKLVELAKNKLKKNKNLYEVRKQIHSKNAINNQSGMICSGEQTVLIYPVLKKDSITIKQIITCIKNNTTGVINLNINGIHFFENETIEKEFDFAYQQLDVWEYKEQLGYKNNLYIIGGGHCSLAFSKIMSSLDFNITIFEDRSDLNTFLQNKWVHTKKNVNCYTELEQLIQGNKNSYVVIMTFGYRTDKIAIKAILNKEFKYIGMLGSKAKIKQLFEELLQEGVSEEKIKCIYSPIGLPIKSETPEEIAISIAAEIIKVKNLTKT